MYQKVIIIYSWSWLYMPFYGKTSNFSEILWSQSSQGNRLANRSSTRAPNGTYQVWMYFVYWFWRWLVQRSLTSFCGGWSHIGYVTRNMWITFYSTDPWMLHKKFIQWLRRICRLKVRMDEGGRCDGSWLYNLWRFQEPSVM